MMNKMKRVAILVLSVVMTAVCVSGCSMMGAAKDNYPSRQVELIVPYAAGGSADVTARAFAPSLEETLGQTVVVVNKPGASGVIGFSYVASASKDGYTIGIVPIASLCINHVLGELTFDPVEDYEMLGGISEDPVALCVSADSPFNTLSDLIDYAKEHPGELSVATSGLTSMDTLMCLDVAKTAGVEFNIVGFDGGGDCITAVMGGHADMMGGTYGEMITYVEAGQLKMLGVGEAGYDVPSFEEQGYPITLKKQIRAIYAPKGLDDEVKATLIKAVETAVKSDGFAEELGKVDTEPCYHTPEECTEFCHKISKALEAFKE